MPRQHDRVISSFSLRHPWMKCLILIACIPLSPEYIAPFLAIGALMFAVRDARRHHRQVRVGAAGRVMIVFLCFMAVHLIWATHRLSGAFTLVYWLAMLCVYLSLATILTTPHRVETALFMLSSIVGILGLLAAAQYVCVAILGWEQVPLQVWDFVDELVYSLAPFPVSLHSLGTRAAATFPNPNLFAQFLLMAIPFVAAYGFTGQRSASKILSRVSLLLGVVGITVTFSRGAYLALGAIAVVMCIANIRRLIPILIVAFSMVLLLPSTVFDRLTSMGDASDVAIIERFEVWGITMLEFLERPLFGHGLGIETMRVALSSLGFAAPHAHNLFLEFLVEGGILGLTLLLLLLWKLFRTGFELIIHAHRTRMFGAAVIAFCGGLCVAGMVDFALFAPKTIGMFFFALALTDAFGFIEMKRPFCPAWQAIPFATTVYDRLETWVRKKTAPKEDSGESPQKEEDGTR